MYKSDKFLMRFKRIGSDVQVFEDSLILKPEEIELDDWSRLDDYCRIEGGRGIAIGKRVHICSFASIYGGEEHCSPAHHQGRAANRRS